MQKIEVDKFMMHFYHRSSCLFVLTGDLSRTTNGSFPSSGRHQDCSLGDETVSNQRRCEKRWGERNRKSVENIREERRKKGFGKEKEEKEMVLKEEKRNASKYVLIWFLTPLKFHIFFNDEHMSWC